MFCPLVLHLRVPLSEPLPPGSLVSLRAGHLAIRLVPLTLRLSGVLSRSPPGHLGYPPGSSPAPPVWCLSRSPPGRFGRPPGSVTCLCPSHRARSGATGRRRRRRVTIYTCAVIAAAASPSAAPAAGRCTGSWPRGMGPRDWAGPPGGQLRPQGSGQCVENDGNGCIISPTHVIIHESVSSLHSGATAAAYRTRGYTRFKARVRNSASCARDN